MSIHSQNEQVILEFGLKKPAFRIVVNSPTTHGSIGLTTGLDPAMTLGCGGYGGNITSDNISPRHLLNIKRLAYEVTPASSRFEKRARRTVAAAPSPAGITRGRADPANRQLPGLARLSRPEADGTRPSKPDAGSPWTLGAAALCVLCPLCVLVDVPPSISSARTTCERRLQAGRTLVDLGACDRDTRRPATSASSTASSRIAPVARVTARCTNSRYC